MNRDDYNIFLLRKTLSPEEFERRRVNLFRIIHEWCGIYKKPERGKGRQLSVGDLRHLWDSRASTLGIWDRTCENEDFEDALIASGYDVHYPVYCDKEHFRQYGKAAVSVYRDVSVFLHSAVDITAENIKDYRIGGKTPMPFRKPTHMLEKAPNKPRRNYDSEKHNTLVGFFNTLNSRVKGGLGFTEEDAQVFVFWATGISTGIPAAAAEAGYSFDKTGGIRIGGVSWFLLQSTKFLLPGWMARSSDSEQALELLRRLLSVYTGSAKDRAKRRLKEILPDHFADQFGQYDLSQKRSQILLNDKPVQHIRIPSAVWQAVRREPTPPRKLRGENV